VIEKQIGLHKPWGVVFLGHQGAGEEIRRNRWETTCRVEECEACRGWHVVYQDWIVEAMNRGAA
jgi:hypothetical protein